MEAFGSTPLGLYPGDEEKADPRLMFLAISSACARSLVYLGLDRNLHRVP